jgi:hypothetical protein
MVVGAGLSFMGSQKAAAAAEDAGEAQRDAANAQARNEELQTAENVRRERQNNRRDLARARAVMAGTSGMAMGGSLQDAFVETAGRLELEVQDKARAGAMDANNITSQGEMALWEAKAKASSTRMASYGTLLSSVSGIASYGSQSGVFAKSGTAVV